MSKAVVRSLSMSSAAVRLGRFDKRSVGRDVGKILVIDLLDLGVIGTQWQHADEPHALNVSHDVSHGLRSFSVYVLTCAFTVMKRDCTRQAEDDVKDGPTVYGQLMCVSIANAIIAGE